MRIALFFLFAKKEGILPEKCKKIAKCGLQMLSIYVIMTYINIFACECTRITVADKAVYDETFV